MKKSKKQKRKSKNKSKNQLKNKMLYTDKEYKYFLREIENLRGKNLEEIIQLKNQSAYGLNSSSKIPVTDLNIGPLWGADSNLHRYKKSRDYYQEERVPRNKYEEEREEQEYKPKMKKTRKSQPKEESGWKWGGVKGPE